MKYVLMLFLVCMAPLFSNAQVLKLHKGDFEVATSGVLNRGITDFEIRLGAFVQDYMQAGVYGAYMDDNLVSRAGVGLYFIHLYETRTYFIPYAGGSLGFGALDLDLEDVGSESGMELQALVGLKYYVADNVSLNTELHAGVSSSDTFIGNRKTESTEVGVRIGLSYLW